jgi:hypothetical protein
LILSGANTYTGSTTIANGTTLLVSNTTGSATGQGAVNVNSGGTLQGSGTIYGVVTLNDGGTNSPGIDGTVGGTLTMSNLTWNGGGVFHCEIDDIADDASGLGHYDRMVVNNALTDVPGTKKLVIRMDSQGQTLAFDTNRNYNLKVITCGTAPSLNPTNVTLDTSLFQLSNSGTWSVTNANKSIWVVYRSRSSELTSNNYWIGSGNWSGATNWSLGHAPLAGESVEFNGLNSTSNCTANAVSNNLASITLASGYTGTVTFVTNAVAGGVDGMSLTLTGDLTVREGALVFIGNKTNINGGTSGNPFGIGYAVQASNVLIAVGASINADSRGFPLRAGPGVAQFSDYCGGGYGGRGGGNPTSGGIPYGSVTNCTALGSGGGHASAAGAGGGAIKLVVTDTVTVNGRLSANGQNPGAYGGGGSGGSIWIASGKLVGSGTMSANGGTGGGGGRMDLSGVTNNFGGSIEVFGGGSSGAGRALAGSLMLPRSAGTGVTFDAFTPYTNIAFGNSVTFGNAVITNGVTLSLDSNSNACTFAFSSLVVQTNGIVECRGNYYQVNTDSGGAAVSPHGQGLVITGATVTVQQGGRIHADAWGFAMQTGPGKGTGNYNGGGYGGLGGGSDGLTYGLTYGSASEPSAVGSGGGNTGGGAGGGAIKVLVPGVLTASGTISAIGGVGTGGYSGGGSGGSLWLDVGTLNGTGTISANGGSGSYGGGGGRILLRYGVTNFTGSFTVNGGSGTKLGSNGTIILVCTAIANQPPTAPALLYPPDGATLRTPYLQFLATDPENDYLRFKVEIATDSGFGNIVKTIDQTASQADWYGQTEQSRTAYASSGTVTVVISPPLTAGTQFFWRAYAVDPAGSNAWSMVSTSRIFTTYATPANYWVCDPNPILGDGLWTSATNWSKRSVPVAGENILFGGDYFNADCTVNSASNFLSSLTLASNYTKTVTFAGKAVAGGMTLTLSGSLVVSSGTLVFQGDTTAIGDGQATNKFGEGYRIEADSVTIGSNGIVHADKAGFPYSSGPGAGTGGNFGRGAGYGGRGGDGSDSNLWFGGGTYGSSNLPTALGSGGGHGTAGRGGGGIWLVVSDKVVVNGRLSADGAAAPTQWASGSSGGSLVVVANTVEGAGLIAARGGTAQVGCGGAGGGRILILFGGTPQRRRAALVGGLLETQSKAALQPSLFDTNNITVTGGGTGTGRGEDGTRVYRRIFVPSTVILVR